MFCKYTQPNLIKNKPNLKKNKKKFLYKVIFALLKGNTTFKDVWGWMIYNGNSQILKEIFQKEKVEMPSKSTLHNNISQ